VDTEEALVARHLDVRISKRRPCAKRALLYLVNFANLILHNFNNFVSLEIMFSVLGDFEALEKFGIRVKALRLRRNLSQEYVAGVVGVSVPTYRKIEQGDGTVEFRHVARALGVLGLAEALGELVPETEPELRLKDLLRPERKHASKQRRKG
jgi:DNA-binding XRE family transcriptional regulator